MVVISTRYISYYDVLVSSIVQFVVEREFAAAVKCKVRCVDV